MAGQHEALKRAIRSARSEAGIKSDQELALKAGVHIQTIQNWMYGKTTPRPSELSKVAAALDMSMADLMAIYEGRDPQPPPLQDAILEQAAAIRDLVAELRESRLAQVSATTVVFEALGALGVRQDPEGTPDDTEHEAPAGTPR